MCEVKQTISRAIQPAQTNDVETAEHGWIGYNSGPCEWFWAEERARLEHELSDDIRPATHLEKYLLNKQGNRTHEHDEPPTSMPVAPLTKEQKENALLHIIA